MNNYRLAIQVFAGVMRTFAPHGEDYTVLGGGLDILNDINLDSSGHNILSIGVTGGIMHPVKDKGDDDDDTFENAFYWEETFYCYKINIDSIFRIGATTKLFFGFDLDQLFNKDISDSAGVFIFHYGIRLFGEHFATDLGLIRPLFTFENGKIHDVEDFMKYLPIGYPFVSFTYKW